tara:strand:+ start:115 stop:621 length:507 start_codon:yes stop_codon:yes gene_type:complete
MKKKRRKKEKTNSSKLIVQSPILFIIVLLSALFSSNTHTHTHTQRKDGKMASSSFAGFSGGIKGTKKKKKINVQEEEEEKDGEKREAVLAVGKDRVHLKEEKKKGEEKKSIPAMRNTFEVGTGRQRKVSACCVYSDASVSSVFSIRMFLFSNRGMYFNQFVCSPPHSS